VSAPFVAMRHISKTFGAVRALRRVDFEVAQGEIVGLVGDNAAGKSTLMKVLTGVYTPDAGEVLIDGRPVRFVSPMDARAAGIEMVYQDFALVPELSVTQNIFLGHEVMRGFIGLRFLDQQAMAKQASELFGRLGLRIPPLDTPVRGLSGGQQQAVAVARATAFDAKLVIMDEPTANLGATAIAKVRETIGRLKAQGVAVTLISHRLEDVFTTADRVVVMKHGHIVGSRRVADTAADEVLHMIVAGTDPRRPATPHASA
jgi:simple sugar transport system ATP-binding protein